MNSKPTSPHSLVVYNYPRSCPRSKTFQVRANGEPVYVHGTNVADFACISFAGSVEIEVEIEAPIKTVVIRPLNLKIASTFSENRLRFTLNRPVNLQIEINGAKKPLHFYGNPLESDLPDKNDPNVLWYKGGQVYEVGELNLLDNQTLYLEGGAILKGNLFASQAKNIRICGRGVLDGSYYRKDEPHVRSIVFDRCEDMKIEDIIMIEPTTWMVVLGACRNVHIRNLKQIGEIISSDGIDIVGSRDVLVEGCFLKNNDDCVVIKSLPWKKAEGDVRDWCRDVDNILVKDCTFMNDGAGNAMEIGHELRTASIRNITFRNCDVLHTHGYGAVFSIHNSDHAEIGNILWEDIRIEHCYDAFIDFRIFKSMWSGDKERGTVRNIHLKNIHWQRTIHNPGYTKSIIGGWDADHQVRDVVFEDVYFDDVKVTNADMLDLFTKSASGITFK